MWGGKSVRGDSDFRGHVNSTPPTFFSEPVCGDANFPKPGFCAASLRNPVIPPVSEHPPPFHFWGFLGPSEVRGGGCSSFDLSGFWAQKVRVFASIRGSHPGTTKGRKRGYPQSSFSSGFIRISSISVTFQTPVFAKN